MPQKNRRKSKPRKTPDSSQLLKNQKKINRSFNLMAGFLIMVFCVYLFGMFFNMSNKTKIESMTLSKIEVTKNDLYTGIITRDEKIYVSPKDGYLTYNVNEGEKIRPGESLFEVSNSGEVSKLDNQLNSINEDLFDLQNFRKEYSMYKNDIDNMESRIESQVQGFNMTNYNDLYNLSKGLNTNIDFRNQILFSDQRVVDSAKSQAKSDLQSKIDANKEVIRAESGGIVSYSYDGLENTFTPLTIDSLSIDKTKMNSDFKTANSSQVIEADKIIRVVESNNWYISTYLPTTLVQNFKVGQSQKIFISTNGELKEFSTVIEFVQKNGDTTLVNFKLKNNMIDFINERSLSIALKSITYKNMKIPKTAIVSKQMFSIPKNFVISTDKKVVIKQTQNGSNGTTEVNIWNSDSTGNNYYLETNNNQLKLGDTLITTGPNPKTYQISKYETIDGVYKINSGTATFEKVIINKDIDHNEQYYYILPSNNLRDYDRILTRSADAQEGQIIE